MSNVNETVTVITLNSCRIGKRGKGVKGQTIETELFGKPVFEKDEEGKETAIAETIEYDNVENYDQTALVEKVKELGFSVNMCLAMGADTLLKSLTAKSQAGSTVLRARLIREGLAENEEKAKQVAEAIITAIQAMKDSDSIDPEDIPTIEDMIQRRKAKLAKEKK